MSVSYDVHVVDRGTDAFVPFVKAWYARARVWLVGASERGASACDTMCVCQPRLPRMYSELP